MRKNVNIESIFPLAGMNSDDDPRYFKEGDYLEAKNIRIGSNQEQGDGMLVQTLKSTLAIALSVPGSIEHIEHLGVAIDEENKIAYLLNFQYYDAGDNDYQDRFIIHKHDLLAGTNKIILNKDATEWGISSNGQTSGLRIDADVVNGKLIFTDDTNNIRQIDVARIEVSIDNNIVTAYRWSSSGGWNEDDIVYDEDYVYLVLNTTAVGPQPKNDPTNYQQLCRIEDCYIDTSDPDLFILAASPPLTKPTANYIDDTSINFNKLRGSVWQFSYRYVYIDYRKSKYAQPSLIPEPDDEEYNTGAPNTSQTKNNRIRVGMSLRNEDIRKIEIVTRSSSDPATWFFIGEINVIDDEGFKYYGTSSSINFYFYNDGLKIPITRDEVYELFPYVPITAKTLTVINNNALVFGNIQETYSQITTDMSVQLAWETLSDTDPIDKHRALKKGITHQWGLIYRDIAGRITPIMGEDQLKLYIPFITESSSSNVNRRPTVSFELNHLPHPDAVSYEIVKLGNSLNAGNTSMLSILQLIGFNIITGKKDHDDPSVLAANLDPNFYRLEIARPQQYARENISNWSVEQYVWQKGDRIRIIGKPTFPPSGNALIINELTSLFDLEISGVYSDTDYDTTTGEGSTGTSTVIHDWIYFHRFSSLVTALSSISSNNQLFVEIYRPLVSSDSDSNFYFTTGMVFEIGVDGNGNRYHKGNTDQTLNASGESTSSAVVQNTSHDVWMYQRNFRVRSNADTYYAWIESDYHSDYYLTEKMNSQGQPLTDINSRNTFLTKRLRHGGTIEPGSKINNIAKFDAGDYLDLEDVDGPIEKVVLVGFVLKAVQHTKVTSIYINRIELDSPSEDPQYAFTDRVFGTKRPNLENWGSRHPGSIISDDRYLYYWNDKEATIIRNAPNGEVPISNNKMSREFKDLADTLSAQSLSNQWVEFAINKDDSDNIELFCLFGVGTSTKTIYVYNEKRNRWMYKIDLSFNYGRFYWLGDTLFHLHSTNIYKWWAGANYQVIGGDQRNGSLSVYTPHGRTRIFNTIIVYQDGSEPIFTSLIVPKKGSGTNRDMETLIYSANIEEQEGVYYCTILNDINTPGAESQDYKLVNGDVLRGLFLNFILSFTGNSKITLSNIEVVTTGSKIKI